MKESATERLNSAKFILDEIRECLIANWEYIAKFNLCTSEPPVKCVIGLVGCTDEEVTIICYWTSRDKVDNRLEMQECQLSFPVAMLTAGQETLPAIVHDYQLKRNKERDALLQEFRTLREKLKTAGINV